MTVGLTKPRIIKTLWVKRQVNKL